MGGISLDFGSALTPCSDSTSGKRVTFSRRHILHTQLFDLVRCEKQKRNKLCEDVVDHSNKLNAWKKILFPPYLRANVFLASVLVSSPPMAPLLFVGRKPMMATSTVRTPQAGCQYSGWYLVMLRHTFLFSSNRPFGYRLNERVSKRTSGLVQHAQNV